MSLSSARGVLVRSALVVSAFVAMMALCWGPGRVEMLGEECEENLGLGGFVDGALVGFRDDELYWVWKQFRYEDT